MLKALGKQVDMLGKYIKKNPLISAAVIVIVVALVVSIQQMRESFRFPLPNMELERDCKDFGYVCCASSYARRPLLIQKCRGGDMMGDKMFYKLVKDDGEIITSGLYNDYLIHAPGAYLRFSDNKLYKLITLNPEDRPANCKIVQKDEPYEPAQSNIPVQY